MISKRPPKKYRDNPVLLVGWCEGRIRQLRDEIKELKKLQKEPLKKVRELYRSDGRIQGNMKSLEMLFQQHHVVKTDTETFFDETRDMTPEQFKEAFEQKVRAATKWPDLLKSRRRNGK